MSINARLHISAVCMLALFTLTSHTVLSASAATLSSDTPAVVAPTSEATASTPQVTPASLTTEAAVDHTVQPTSAPSSAETATPLATVPTASESVPASAAAAATPDAEPKTAQVEQATLSNAPIATEPSQQPVQQTVQQSEQTQTASIEELPHVIKARENLRDFAYSKLISMASKLCFTSSNHCVEQKEGQWVASYKDIAPDTLIVQVKPVDGTSNRFVGLIKYAVLNFEARADTRPMLAQQEFQMVKRMWQTEILRYDGKVWK